MRDLRISNKALNKLSENGLPQPDSEFSFASRILNCRRNAFHEPDQPKTCSRRNLESWNRGIKPPRLPSCHSGVHQQSPGWILPDLFRSHPRVMSLQLVSSKTTTRLDGQEVKINEEFIVYPASEADALDQYT